MAAEFVGALPEPQVRQFIAKLGAAPAAGAGEADKARTLRERRWAEAEPPSAAQDRRQPAAVALGLAKALLAQGKAREAEPVLDGIKDGPEFVAAEKLRPLARYLIASGSVEDVAGADTPAADFFPPGAGAEGRQRDRRAGGDAGRSAQGQTLPRWRGAAGVVGPAGAAGRRRSAEARDLNKLASVLF